MSITKIYIQNDRFWIVEQETKDPDQDALSTLKQIEDIMRKSLPYLPIENDKYAKLSREELWQVLNEKAFLIQNKFLKKTSKISFLGRTCLNIPQKEIEIKKTYANIEELVYRDAPPIFKLPNELIQHIGSFLQIQDLCQATQVSRTFKDNMEEAQIQRAVEYGYNRNSKVLIKNESLAEARRFLQQFLEAMRNLINDKHIPQELVKIKLHQNSIELESTYRNILQINPEKKIEFSNNLGKSLRGYVIWQKTATVATVLKLGGNCNIITKGKTPLQTALTCSHQDKELIHLLINHADVNISTEQAEAPLFYTNDPEIMEWLCQKGAHVNAGYEGGKTALHFDVFSGRIDCAKVLLKYKADPNIRDSRGYTPLLYAMGARERNKEVIPLLIAQTNVNIPSNDGYTPLMASTSYHDLTELLCQKGALIDERETVYGRTALHYAVERNNTQSARVLLKNKANPSIQDSNGNTPLHVAMKTVNEPFIELLLGYIDDVNIINNLGYSPLCINTSNPRITERLCRKKALVNQRTPCANTALHIAVSNKHFESAKMLLTYGADITARNHKGQTPLHLAVLAQHPDLVSLLIKSGADVNSLTNDHSSPLCLNKGDIAITEMLCQKQANVNYQYPSGTTVLHINVIGGYVESVKVLLQYGADPSIRNKQGRMALYYAEDKEMFKVLLQKIDTFDEKDIFLIFMFINNSELTELLCKKKIDPNFKIIDTNSNFYDCTSLEYAFKKWYFDSAGMLLKYGAYPNARNNKGQTSLHIALSQRYIRLTDIQSLVHHGANVNTQDHEGYSPVCYASSLPYARHDIVEFLCQKKANVNQQSSQGYTALHLAACRDYEEIVRILLKYGANQNLTDKNGKRPIDLAKGRTKAVLKEAQKSLLS